MKKTLFYMVAFFAMTLGFVSCDKDENDSVGICGDWEVISGEDFGYINGELAYQEAWSNEGYVYRFNEDGTYWTLEDGEPDDAGTYSYEDGVLILEEDGEEFLIEVLSLTSSKMVWRETDSHMDGGDEYKEVFETTLKKVK